MDKNSRSHSLNYSLKFRKKTMTKSCFRLFLASVLKFPGNFKVISFSQSEASVNHVRSPPDGMLLLTVFIPPNLT